VNEDTDSPSEEEQFEEWMDGEKEYYVHVDEVVELLSLMNEELRSVVKDSEWPLKMAINVLHEHPPYKEFTDDLWIVYKEFQRIVTVRRQLKRVLWVVALEGQRSKWRAGDNGLMLKLFDIYAKKLPPRKNSIFDEVDENADDAPPAPGPNPNPTTLSQAATDCKSTLYTFESV
jgi:hypothetical protein